MFSWNIYSVRLFKKKKKKSKRKIAASSQEERNAESYLWTEGNAQMIVREAEDSMMCSLKIDW